MQPKNKTVKLISSLVIISIIVPAVLFSKPKQSEAIWFATWLTDTSTTVSAGTTGVSAVANTTSTALAIKNAAKEIGKQILMRIASKLLQQMTKSTINWINTGNWGNPLFLENPESFFKDIAKYEVKNMVDLFGYDQARYPFGKDFALNTINSYKRQLTDNASYTLSNVIKDPILLKSYQNDFNVGGWNGFLINTQYPQNNYIGFQMQATEELARRLQGTTQNAAQKVQAALQQGAGFLSPQTCADNNGNNKYNETIANQFQRPRWDEGDYTKNQPYENPYTCSVGEFNEDDDCENYSKYDAEWRSFRDQAKAEWTKDSTCKNLVNTTPGSVVGNKIMTALGSGQQLTVLGATMGNSISALVDALLNKFISKGLNSLTSRTNNTSDSTDNWSYDGQTLGSPSGVNTTWDAGPDQEILLSDFKKAVNDGIENTETELKIISNTDVNSPGITEMFGAIWPKTRELDMCVPGPNILWQARADSEMQRNSNLLSEKINDDDPQKAASATIALKDLQFAANFFKDWINNKMMTTLPKSVIYMDAVDEIETLYQESDELIDARRLKTQTVSRLEAIKSGLDTITEQPEPGSGEEKVLIKLKQQYDATRDTISNPATIDSRKNQLNIAIDKYKKINGLIPECQQARLEKGWTNPGGRRSTYLDQGTEQNLFCDFPIKGGYSHNSFIGPDTTVPKVPMVNGKDVMNWPRFFGLFGTKRVNIEMNCDIIYKANVLDYKQNLPGLTPITEDFEDLTGDFGGEGGGQCDATGNQYAGVLRTAMDAVLAERPDIAALDPRVNTPRNGREYRANAIEFLKLTAEKLQSMDYMATEEVLNGNNLPSTGDLIAVWDSGDSVMERYDAIDGSRTTVSAAAVTNFDAFIPINCTTSGGGNNCACQSNTGGTTPEPNPTTPAPTNPNPGTLFVSAVSPTSVARGSTITITGEALTSTVRFFDGGGGINTVTGTLNSTNTQVRVVVPTELPIGNSTVKIYKDANTTSNGRLIQITSGATNGGSVTTMPSVNATGGWGGNLAYNPAADNFLVVSGGVNGRIMKNDGTAVTPEFTINTSTGVQLMAPKVAFASDINKYLVVWIGGWSAPDTNRGTFYGRFVNADGSMSGNVFEIYRDPAGGASIFYANSALQYDSRNKKFVLVWDYRHPTADVNLLTISQSGIPGTVVDIGNDAIGESWLPSVAVNENSNEYCVAYDKRNNGPTVTAVRKFNAATGTLGAETIINNGGQNTSIVYNSVNKKYLIGWGSDVSPKSEGRILNSCNITDGGNIFTINSAGRAVSVAYNPKSNNYATIVQNQYDSDNTYNILSSTGAKISSGVAFTGGFGNFFPVIVANTIDGTFAVTSSREYAVTRFAPGLGTKLLTTTTTTASTPKYLDLGGGAFPDVVWHKGRLYVAYRSGNYLAINLYSFDKDLGDKKTEKIFTLNAGAGGFPRLTVSNNVLWLAFRDGESSGEDIKLWRQDTGAIESLGGAVGNNPVALGHGYIAWQKCEGTKCASSKVYRRLLTGGTPTFIQNWLPTGISRILSNGSVVMIDTDRTAVSWGLDAWFAGKLAVGTDITPNDDNGIAGRFSSVASSEFNLWLGQRAHTPHTATDGLGNYAVSTWNPSVRVATFTGPQ